MKLQISTSSFLVLQIVFVLGLVVQAKPSLAQTLEVLPSTFTPDMLAFQESGVSYSAEVRPWLCHTRTFASLDCEACYAGNRAACKKLGDHPPYGCDFIQPGGAPVFSGCSAGAPMKQLVVMHKLCIENQFNELKQALSDPDTLHFVRDILEKKEVVVKIIDATKEKRMATKIKMNFDPSIPGKLIVGLVLTREDQCVVIPAVGDKGLGEIFENKALEMGLGLSKKVTQSGITDVSTPLTASESSNDSTPVADEYELAPQIFKMDAPAVRETDASITH